MAKPEALGEGNPCQSQWTEEEHSDNAVLPARTHGCGPNKTKARRILLTTFLQGACLAVCTAGSNEVRAKMPDWFFSTRQASQCYLQNTCVSFWACLPDLIFSLFPSLGVSYDVFVDHINKEVVNSTLRKDCSRSCAPALWLKLEVHGRGKAQEQSSHRAVSLHTCITRLGESVIRPGLSRTCVDTVHPWNLSIRELADWPW